MRVRSRWSAASVAAAALTLSATACSAQESQSAGGEQSSWQPTQDVVLTVPFGAGGGTDTMARAIARGLEEVRPNINIVVQNRSGGHGATGYTHVYQQKGDPHQLVAVSGSLPIVPLTTEVPYEGKDFTMIGQVSEHVGLLAAPSGEFGGLQDFVRAASQEQQVLALGSGRLSIFGLMAAAVEKQTDSRFQYVAYDTGSSAVNSLVAGDADVALTSPEHAASFIDAGKVDGLALLTDERIQSAPLKGVPTAQEQGINVVFAGARGLAAAPGLTKEQQQYWVKAFSDWLDTSSYEQYIEKTGSLAKPGLAKQMRESTQSFKESADELIKFARKTQQQ